MSVSVTVTVISPQGEVCTMITKKYSEFLPGMQSAEELVARVDGLSRSVDLLRAGVENEVTAFVPFLRV